MIGRQNTEPRPWQALSPERFGFLLFLAAALHGLVLLAVSFERPKPPPPAHTLDITLAQFQHDKAPEKADFIAQHNQQGSGTSDTKQVPTSTETAAFTSSQTQSQSAQPSPAPTPAPPLPAEPTPPTPKPVANKAAPAEQSGQKRTLTTTQPKPAKAQLRTEQKAAAKPQPQAGQSTSLLARSLEIASLQAQLDTERQDFAKRPRVHRLTAASTLSHADAVYLENWRRRIESVGNLNYPEQARRDRIHGALRLLVKLLPDGSVRTVEILESSGHAILDDAAIRIVRLAAPFQPFPVEMRKQYDELELIRTWKFEKQARVY